MSDRLQVKILEDAAFKPPELKPAKEGDVGLDLVACISNDIVIPAQGFENVPCGIAIKLPWGTWASIRARSSTFAKRRLMVFDGTIDEGFTGQLKLFIFNPNKYDVILEKGARIAQLVIYNKIKCDIVYVDELPHTERGTNGFGSTGE